MSEQILNLSTKFDSLFGTKSSISTIKEANEGEELDVMLNEIKSSDDLYKLKNFEINSQMELMTCLSCSKHKTHAPKQLQSTIKSSFGVFRFIEQDGGYNQTQKFRDLKKSIRFHLSNSLHIWCARKEQKEKEEADDVMRKNEKAGYNIGRIALFCIRTGLGGLKFVESVNLIDLCGGTVGNYRHSRYIYDRLRSVMAEEMKLKITEYLVRVDPVLQHSVPFGVTFDKVTLLKRSIQTTLLITFVDGVLTPIYLQSPLCKTELSGKELVDNCIHVMNSFGLTKKMLQQQLSGCAVDGAYIHLNIDKHLSSALEMNSEWLTVSWDCAHLLELAINDVKRQRKFVWINNFIKLCAALMRKYSYGKQYEILLETAQYLDEDILASKQFHTTRFVSSERRVYETILRDWRSLHEVQEEEDQLNALSHGDVSTRTRRAYTVLHEGTGSENTLKLDDISSIDFVGKLLGLNDVYSLIVKSSMSIQMVNTFPWEYSYALEKLKKSLSAYAAEVEKLSNTLNNTQEMEDVDEVPFATQKAPLDDDEEGGESPERENEAFDEVTLTSTHLSLHYNDLLRGEFQGRPVTRKAVEHDLDDPTLYFREKLVDFCQALRTSIDTRFEEAPAIFETMAKCLDVAALYQEVILAKRGDVLQYGQSSFQSLLDFTKNSSKYIKIDSILLHDQYLKWKKRCLTELKDKENWNVWTKDDRISTTKVMKSFLTNRDLASGIEQFLHLYSLMVVKIRNESAASILKQHIHSNRVLDHESLDEEVMLHWNAPPLHLADPFIKSSLDNYFYQLKDKIWVFFKKTDHNRLFKLVSPGSVVSNRLRKQQVQRIPMLFCTSDYIFLIYKDTAKQTQSATSPRTNHRTQYLRKWEQTPEAQFKSYVYDNLGGKENVWCTTGMKTLSLDKIKQHKENSEVHKQAEAQELLVPSRLQPDWHVTKQKEVEKHERAVQNLMLSCIYLIQIDSPLACIESLCNLLEKLEVQLLPAQTSGVSYRNNDAAIEFLNHIANYLHEELVEKIQSSPVVGMSNLIKTTEKSCIVFARYIDNYEEKTAYYGLLDLEGNGTTNNIVESLNCLWGKDDINVSKSCWFASDNASTFTGVNEGVVAKLRRHFDCEWLESNSCAAHTFNLVGSQACYQPKPEASSQSLLAYLQETATDYNLSLGERESAQDLLKLVLNDEFLFSLHFHYDLHGTVLGPLTKIMQNDKLTYYTLMQNVDEKRKILENWKDLSTSTVTLALLDYVQSTAAQSYGGFQLILGDRDSFFKNCSDHVHRLLNELDRQFARSKLQEGLSVLFDPQCLIANKKYIGNVNYGRNELDFVRQKYKKFPGFDSNLVRNEWESLKQSLNDFTNNFGPGQNFSAVNRIQTIGRSRLKIVTLDSLMTC
ncbi:unnamed protein product [Adineta ricciae]|uniref:DUF4371 domain-containing protein n=1 Tax=Adineta ricciae TaxID=249248 RepID=A0A815KL14_ADIRI|nr:unnamed protein product [Adineta ricciae]